MSDLQMKITLCLSQITEAVKRHILREQSLLIMDFCLNGKSPTLLVAKWSSELCVSHIESAIRTYVNEETGMVSGEIEWIKSDFGNYYSCTVTVSKPSQIAIDPVIATEKCPLVEQPCGPTSSAAEAAMPGPDNYPSS